MTARWLLLWLGIAVLFGGVAFLFNGVFFGSWTVTWQQGLTGVLFGFFAGALLDLFLASLGEAEA